MKFFYITFIFCIVVNLVYSDEFEHFILKTGKRYSKKEEILRRSIFEKTKNDVNKHNLEFSKGLQSFEMSLNQFSDMSFKEVIAGFTGRKMIVNIRQNVKPLSLKVPAVPSSIDWRQKGLVTPIKNQGNCGCCWAFSVVGALEGQYAKKYGKLLTFSEQQILDCDTTNEGCNGGLEEPAFEYVTKNGIMNSSAYPYKYTQSSKCSFNSKKIAAKFNSYVAVPVSEAQLKLAVGTYGPISVAIYTNSDFMRYKKGVFSTANCKTDYNSLNHAVLVVGYGTDNVTNYDYWIVKNSWGASWGENGYVRMRRNYKNMCGIATNGIYALAI